MARTHKRTERLIADYLGAEADEHGSQRAWKDLWDVSPVGNDGRRWYVEVKSETMRGGLANIRQVCEDAWEQLALACAKAGAVGPRAVVYRPTHTRGIGNSVVYCQLAGQMILMWLDDFRARFIERGDDDAASRLPAPDLP